jgi:cell division protein FtsI (penicillin-binding protein 3)
LEIKRDILWRVYLSFIGIVILSLFVMGRAFYIQRVEGAYWRNLSDSLHQKFVELDAERGTIYSEDDQMLSTSIPYFDIYIDFAAEGLRDKGGKRFKENIDSFSIALAEYFKDKPSAEYKRELKAGYNKKSRYYPLKKNLSFEQFKAFRQFPLVRFGRNKSGVIVETKSKRLNPYGLLARRTIGLARDNAQNVGLERTYDSLLKGTTGRRLVRFIAGGAPVPVEGYEIDPENGRDIITTIDIRMQDIVESELMKMMVTSESQSGTCIVMETKTGKIKAIANLSIGKDGSYDENLNVALHSTEPGSTIKLATLLAVLEEGTVTINDPVNVGTSGAQYVGVRNVTDAERSPKAVMSVKECFAHSSNVGMSKLAYNAFATQPDVYKKYLEQFHLHKITDIGLMGEGIPRLPRLKKNKEGLHAMVTASFGYAIEVTPLHTLMLYNAVANNGKMMKPYLVNQIRRNGVTETDFEPVVLSKNITSPGVIRAARECLEAVAIEGTAKKIFKDFPFAVAGKTGTAHVASGNIKYHHGVYQASFAGYFPADNPEYSMIVVIKTKPYAAMHYGGQLAAPVFREVAAKIYPLYVNQKRLNPLPIVADSTNSFYAGSANDIKNVLKTLDVRFSDASNNLSWVKFQTDSGTAVVAGKPVGGKLMPDVQKMSLKDALYLLENQNIKVAVSGRGKVVAQSLAPGSVVSKNQKVTLLLN